MDHPVDVEDDRLVFPVCPGTVQLKQAGIVAPGDTGCPGQRRGLGEAESTMARQEALSADFGRGQPGLAVTGVRRRWLPEVMRRGTQGNAGKRGDRRRQAGDRLLPERDTGIGGITALEQLGYDVKLYDGSYLEWVQHGMPEEIVEKEH